jgi:hypothetical protein
MFLPIELNIGLPQHLENCFPEPHETDAVLKPSAFGATFSRHQATWDINPRVPG